MRIIVIDLSNIAVVILFNALSHRARKNCILPPSFKSSVNVNEPGGLLCMLHSSCTLWTRKHASKQACLRQWHFFLKFRDALSFVCFLFFISKIRSGSSVLLIVFRYRLTVKKNVCVSGCVLFCFHVFFKWWTHTQAHAHTHPHTHTHTCYHNSTRIKRDFPITSYCHIFIYSNICTVWISNVLDVIHAQLKKILLLNLKKTKNKKKFEQKLHMINKCTVSRCFFIHTRKKKSQRSLTQASLLPTPTLSQNYSGLMLIHISKKSTTSMQNCIPAYMLCMQIRGRSLASWLHDTGRATDHYFIQVLPVLESVVTHTLMWPTQLTGCQEPPTSNTWTEWQMDTIYPPPPPTWTWRGEGVCIVKGFMLSFTPYLPPHKLSVSPQHGTVLTDRMHNGVWFQHLKLISAVRKCLHYLL